VENQTNNFRDQSRFVETYGEVLANGAVIDLVTTPSRDSVTLLYWDGQNHKIGQQVEDGSTIYQAPYLHASLLAAIGFAPGPAEYGSPTELFWKVVSLVCHYMGFSRELAAVMTQAVFRSWFPDCCARPITLCISGMDMDQVMKLFRLFHALCRRSLVVAELSHNLPLFLSPTLLVNVPAVSASAGGRWRASNYRGAFVLGPRGTVRNIACSKIIFCETEPAREVWGPEAMHIALLPTNQELPALTEAEEAQLAEEYQPQFLLFRLRNLFSMSQSVLPSCSPRPAGFELGNLPACIAEDHEIVEAIAPVLEARAQELLARRSLDPHVAIVEALWSPVHPEKEISVKELTKRVNALLRLRGEISTCNTNQLGWKLRNLGLQRVHNGRCKVLRISRETSRRVHELAQQFALKLPKVPECANCENAQTVVPK
jgi:hypothetical protein